MIHYVTDNLLSILFFTAWLIYMCVSNEWYRFQIGWPMTITMAFGSFVAGSTPLGSGAVSYPVLVLVLKVISNNARTCALMIQSIGMTSASYRILKLYSSDINETSTLYMIVNGVIGYNIGYYLVRLPGEYVKSIYFSITMALGVILQSYINTFFPKDRKSTITLYKKDFIIFVPISILGGILISMVGTGLDVVLYIYFRLFHNTEELVTTNHTILVQSFIVLFGFYNALVINHDITEIVWTYWLCSVPVVLFFAPLGNYMINKWKNRSKLNKYIYVLETFQYVAGFVITISKMTNTIIISCAIVGSSFLFIGTRYLFFDRKNTKIEARNTDVYICA